MSAKLKKLKAEREAAAREAEAAKTEAADEAVTEAIEEQPAKKEKPIREQPASIAPVPTRINKEITFKVRKVEDVIKAVEEDGISRDRVLTHIRYWVRKGKMIKDEEAGTVVRVPNPKADTE